MFLHLPCESRTPTSVPISGPRRIQAASSWAFYLQGHWVDLSVGVVGSPPRHESCLKKEAQSCLRGRHACTSKKEGRWCFLKKARVVLLKTSACTQPPRIQARIHLQTLSRSPPPRRPDPRAPAPPPAL